MDEMIERARHVFVAGALARVSSATLMCPVDTVKTRLQFQGRYTSVRRYASTMDTFRAIFREEGLLGFFRGLPPRLVYITPAAAVSFMFYEQFRVMFRRHREGKLVSSGPRASSLYEHMLAPLVAGGAARALGVAARTPFDIVRQRLNVRGALPETSAYKRLGMIGAVRQILREDGVRGVLVGYTVTLMRDVPFSAFYFLSYELSKELQSSLVRRSDPSASLHVTHHLLSGACAGGIAGTLTIPMDVIKTRLQTQAALPPGERRLTGVADAIREVYREDGLKGFSRGLTTRLLYLMPAASLTFAFYEFYKGLLGADS